MWYIVLASYLLQQQQKMGNYKNCPNKNAQVFGKDWMALSVVFGTCIGSLFYCSYQMPNPNKMDQEVQPQ